MLAALAIRALARDLAASLPQPPLPRVPASAALLAALPDAPDDPVLWATLALLVHPLPAPLHDINIPLAHPALPRLRPLPDSPDFSLVTLVALPSCPAVRDDTVPRLRALPRLVALDLRGCAISSHAIAALTRPLPAPPPLRLLSLHGCPNVDDDVLPALLKFPLLTALDLRFTRCTPAAVSACLSSPGFRPSDNNSLFHPAPLVIALCTLEKLAHARVPLYSCPTDSVFRVHVDKLDLGEPTRASNVASFYHTRSSPHRSILPLSAQAVRSSEGRPDPLALARPPPPWTAPQTESPHEGPPFRGTTLQVDRARMHKRDSDAVTDMVHQFARKRPKIESEFALVKAHARTSVKPRNPFMRSVFADPVPIRASHSLPTEATQQQSLPRPLRPITSLKPPVLPKALLPTPPRAAPNLKQTRLAFR